MDETRLFDSDDPPAYCRRMRENPEPTHLALFMPDLHGGGVARCILDLAEAFSKRGHRVDLVLCSTSGDHLPHLQRIAALVNVVELRPSILFPAHLMAWATADVPALSLHAVRSRRPLITLPYLPALARYLRRQRPAALLAAKTPANLAALWAARCRDIETRIVISERTHLPSELANRRGWRFLLPVIRRNYGRADVQTAISNGVAEALAQCSGVPRQKIVTIYNGVVDAESVEQKVREEVDHPWLQPNSPPVILSAGRLVPQKDLPTLLRAFARVRATRQARLVILGEGELRPQLGALAKDLQIDADLALPGFVQNPFAYMARAAVFALSSAWEGLGNVLIQALATGCPVVSTDCPSGPSEILEGGAYGRLVPVGDDEALAQAILGTLDEPPNPNRLRERAECFSIEQSAEKYLAVLLGK